jgi:spore germination protein YaaH
MKILSQLFCSAILLLGFSTSSYSMENIFYFLRSNAPEQQVSVQNGLQSLKEHYQSIDAVITQAYQIDAQGNVTGYVNKDMIDFAKQHQIKIIILVTNQGFDKEKAHQFLLNEKFQQKAIQALVKICQDNHYYGVQLDYENIHIKDKTKLTSFFLNATRTFHQHGLNVSYAVVPAMTESDQASVYQKKKFDNWGGAYDLSVLGKAADFISIMAYDQHLEGTTPGPYAGMRWVVAVVEHALKHMPASKISLGVPVYSGYWYTGGTEKHVSVRTSDLGYQDVRKLLKKNHVTLRWDNEDKVNYAAYKRAWLNEYIFVEDGASFKAKVDLAKRYKLHGVSVFNLGNEDARIWQAIA